MIIHNTLPTSWLPLDKRNSCVVEQVTLCMCDNKQMGQPRLHFIQSL